MLNRLNIILNKVVALIDDLKLNLNKAVRYVKGKYNQIKQDVQENVIPLKRPGLKRVAKAVIDKGKTLVNGVLLFGSESVVNPIADIAEKKANSVVDSLGDRYGFGMEAQPEMTPKVFPKSRKIGAALFPSGYRR